MLEALFLGLLGSWHCALMCGGFLWGPRPAAYLAGRLLGYAAVGAALGWGGQWLLGFLGSRLVLGFSGVLLLFMARARLPLAAKNSASWVGYMLRELGPWLRGPGTRARFLLGLATAAFPCGLLSAAWLLAIGHGSPAGGALSMSLFWLGTLPGLLLPRYLGRALGGWNVTPWALGLAGAWMLAQALWPETPGLPGHCAMM
ncbi:MAG: sulfite exporter TauE/SafE family protein [Candidatus Eremiobacteraeota bacterium]|nr:sulfite exporter TauE/SafE family protein [Candidatus Eremiobacteraeota bacterium]